MKSKADERLYSASALASLTKLDRRTTTKRLLKVKPARVGVNGCHRYRLADALPALVTAYRQGESHRARRERLQADMLQIEHDIAMEQAWPASVVIDVWTFTASTILSALDAAHGIPQDERDKFRRDVHSRLTSRGSPICNPSFFDRANVKPPASPRVARATASRVVADREK